MAKRAKLAAQ